MAQTMQEIESVVYKWLATKANRNLTNNESNGRKLATFINEHHKGEFTLDSFDEAYNAIKDTLEHTAPEVRVVEKIVKVPSKAPTKLIEQESAPPGFAKRETPQDTMAEITRLRSLNETTKVNNELFFACQSICTRFLGNSHGVREYNATALQEKFNDLRKSNLVPAEIFKQLTEFRRTLRD